jgi:cleavage and polyadenylation specificity factor subunit 1
MFKNEDLEMSADFFNTRTKQTSSLRPFSNIAGYSGFAIINPSCSYLVFFCLRSGLTAHPLWLDGALASFTPLQNSQITMSGFVYMNKSFDIRISTLPTADESGKLAVHYDSSWVLRKVQLRQSVHFLVFHEESKCYAVVTSVNEQTNRVIQSTEEAKDPNTSATEPKSKFDLKNYE